MKRDVAKKHKSDFNCYEKLRFRMDEMNAKWYWNAKTSLTFFIPQKEKAHQVKINCPQAFGGYTMTSLFKKKISTFSVFQLVV